MTTRPRFDLTTFTGVTLAYRTLLMANPLKALKICGDSFAFLTPDDDLMNCEAGPDGFPQWDKAKPFDRAGWDEEFECWAGDASDEFQIASSIYSPSFVDLYDLTTYDGVIAAYTYLLKRNPGRALKLGGDTFAIMLGGTDLVGCGPDAEPDVAYPDYCFDFCNSAFDDERGCWDCDESPAQTAGVILNPEFAPIFGVQP